MKIGLAATLALLLTGSLTVSTGDAATSQDTATPEAHQAGAPGVGVLCMWALTTAAAEVGRRCHSGQNPEFQAELDRAVTLFDEYVRRNSSMAPEEFTAFKQRQGLAGAPESRLCTGDPLGGYETMAQNVAERGIDEFRQLVDHLLARPGPPTWGDCV